jgi:hypothetical protein
MGREKRAVMNEDDPARSHALLRSSMHLAIKRPFGGRYLASRVKVRG